MSIPILEMTPQEKIENGYDEYKTVWQERFTIHLPQYHSEIQQFFQDKELGLHHSFEVSKKAREMK